MSFLLKFELSVESNCDMTENLKKIDIKMTKIEDRYQRQESKSRSDVLEYIKTMEDYSDSSLTNAELHIINEILRTVQSYELIFSTEFPEDVDKKITMLKKIPMLKKRRREESDQEEAKRQKI